MCQLQISNAKYRMNYYCKSYVAMQFYAKHHMFLVHDHGLSPPPPYPPMPNPGSAPGANAPIIHGLI
jgi:hypothetical protein